MACTPQSRSAAAVGEVPVGEVAVGEVAAAVRDRWPPVEIIPTAACLTESGLTLPLRAEFFGKPIRREEVAAAMRRLAGPPPNPA